MGKKIIIPGADFSANGIHMYEYPVESLVSCGGTINNDGLWQETGDIYCGSIIPLNTLSDFSKVSIKSSTIGNGTNYLGLTFLTESTPNFGNPASFASDWESVEYKTSPNTIYTFNIPANATSLYIYLRSGSDTDFIPQEIIFE